MRMHGQSCYSYAIMVCRKLFTLLDLCVSSLRRGHANLLCIVPILTDDPRRESKGKGWDAVNEKSFTISVFLCAVLSGEASVTVAILAQGTTLADAGTQASYLQSG